MGRRFPASDWGRSGASTQEVLRNRLAGDALAQEQLPSGALNPGQAGSRHCAITSRPLGAGRATGRWGRMSGKAACTAWMARVMSSIPGISIATVRGRYRRHGAEHDDPNGKARLRPGRIGGHREGLAQPCPGPCNNAAMRSVRWKRRRLLPCGETRAERLTPPFVTPGPSARASAPLARRPPPRCRRCGSRPGRTRTGRVRRNTPHWPAADGC